MLYDHSIFATSVFPYFINCVGEGYEPIVGLQHVAAKVSPGNVTASGKAWSNSRDFILAKLE